MGKTVIQAFCTLSEAFVSGFYFTAEWANPTLAAIGLTKSATELFGSNKSLSKEFQLAVQEATKKTAKHFRNPEYKPRNLDELFEEVAVPKDLNELLEQIDCQKAKYMHIYPKDLEEVVRFFEISLQIEVANYPALARYYLLIGDRLNQDNLRTLVQLETENGRVANEILGDVQLIVESCQNNGDGIRTLLNRSEKMEKRWMNIDRLAAFLFERLANATIIFAIFLLVCLISDNRNTIDVLGLLMGLVVLSDMAEYFYYKKYQNRIMNAMNMRYDLLASGEEPRKLSMKKWRSIFTSAHIRSTVVEALIQCLMLVAMVLVATNVISDFSNTAVFCITGGMALGVAVKYMIRTMHIIVTPEEGLRCEWKPGSESDEKDDLG